MGIGMADVEYLSTRGHLGRATRILDIGAQCLLGVEPEAVVRFARSHGCSVSDDVLEKEAERISYFSTVRPGERTTYLSELIDLTFMQYTSYDVAPALKTDILDLNSQTLPVAHHERFDLVLNCGTTEHIINQLNCLRIMREAAALGATMMHQVPTAGYGGHGYFCYHEEFFRDIAMANSYELGDLWYTPVNYAWINAEDLDLRDSRTPAVQKSAQPMQGAEVVPSYNINVVMRKLRSSSFAVPLELATAHSAPSDRTTNTIAADIGYDYRYIRTAALANVVLGRVKARSVQTVRRLLS